MKKTIIIQERATISAVGEHNNGNCKPVICLPTFEIFTSCLDAAQAKGVNQATMSAYCNGKVQHPDGLIFCYVSDLSSHIDDLAIMFAPYGSQAAKRLIEERRQAAEEKRRIKREAELAKTKLRMDKQQSCADELLKQLKTVQESLAEAKAYYSSLLEEESQVI